MCRETILRYSSPAENFNEALPIGNGRIGAMIYGDTAYEKIPLNEDSVWSGGLRHRVNPDAAEGLAEVRSLIKKGDIPQAERICEDICPSATCISTWSLAAEQGITAENWTSAMQSQRSLLP